MHKALSFFKSRYLIKAYAFSNLPALMQDVQTFIDLTVPLIFALTVCKFGNCLCTFCLCEKEIFAALIDFLPHISQTCDMGLTFHLLYFPS